MAARKRTPPPFFDPHTSREIIMIFFFALAGLMLLAYVGLAGRAGLVLDKALAHFAGSLRLLLPLLLMITGVFWGSGNFRGLILLALLLNLLSLTALVHLLLYPGTTGLQAVNLGKGGGYLGIFLAYPLYQLFGRLAALVILTALFLIALSLWLKAPLSRLLFGLLFLGQGLQKLGNYGWRFFKSKKNFPEVYPAPEENSPDQAMEFEEHLLQPSPQDTPETRTAPAQGTASAPLKILPETLAPQSSENPIKRTGPLPLPLELLDQNGSKPVAGDIHARQEIIVKTLKNFNIEVEMGEVSVGPTVTQYTLRPAEGVKLSSITALQNDLALALAAHPLRLEAPIPGKALVGIEVPNAKIAIVRLRELLETLEWKKRPSNLTLVLGRDVSGKPWITELARMPHLLVAGATGSGKTVCLNTLILALLYQNSPDDLKFLLIDPKRVELPSFNGIPHLISPVLTDLKETIQALRWTIVEMERRFQVLASSGARDIKSYNADKTAAERLPYLILVVDELADLMVAAASEVEGAIIRLAQMARAVGIHLILATQRPSVDVLTGLIKANITARIAFSVASLTDSRTILDSGGAEKLLGRGDLLFISAELSKPKRLQGAYVSDQEIKRVVDYLRQKDAPDYVSLMTAPSSGNGAGLLEAGDEYAEDPLLTEAKEIILQAGKASASLLQRRLKIGYARAARILDLLEQAKFIGPGEGAKPRAILSPDQNF